ncbi:hypothetical protein [Lacisediminihabitans changchengi]|uniref:Uncharacterized protein n=1 Tax=Lacisediminihabitans changchengi TaxID=2787634 RepID=A0A934SKE4_9MICO|nr:hypothetical protein [Lacisediminihabitans changchengi]MBK4348246.1 hypothetical protein [Lacisediminihabitans changchengi]
MSIDQPVIRRFPLSAIPVWAVVAVGALLVLLLASGGQRLVWMPIVLIVGVLGTFVIQLGLDQKVGLVNRVIVSLSGSVVILGLATTVVPLLAP